MSNRNRRGTRQQAVKHNNTAMTLSDSLDEDVLAKLKAAKTELAQVERENEEKRQAKIRQERKEREANKSFEELLNEYDNHKMND